MSTQTGKLKSDLFSVSKNMTRRQIWKKTSVKIPLPWQNFVRNPIQSYPLWIMPFTSALYGWTTFKPSNLLLLIFFISDWTHALTKFLKDQLNKIADFQSHFGGITSSQHQQRMTPEMEQATKQWNYTVRLSHWLYEVRKSAPFKLCWNKYMHLHFETLILPSTMWCPWAPLGSELMSKHFTGKTFSYVLLEIQESDWFSHC